MVALMALSDLEQLEGPWMELMQSKDPESVAVAFRFALAHLTQTSKRLQMADVIQCHRYFNLKLSTDRSPQFIF